MKRKYKILLSLLLVLCLALSLAACAAERGASGSPAEGRASAGSTKAPETAGGSEPVYRNDDGASPAMEGWKEASIAGGKAKSGFASDGGSVSYDMASSFTKSSAGEFKSAAEGEPGTPDTPDTPVTPGTPVAPDDGEGPGSGLPIGEPEPLKLTAAEWKDNDNWPFFTNLVNAGTIAFPSFGLDPRNRVEIRVQSEDGTPLVNETVVLADAEGTALWQARTNKAGTAYVFWAEGQTPDRVVCGAAEAPVQVSEPSDDPQGKTQLRPVEAVTLTLSTEAKAQSAMQIMFIVDTTGSMGDEIAYLQKDFSAIAGRVGGDGISWSANFYRDEGDEYVTRTNGFTSDVAEVQAKINAEYADGGGDTPEAVAEILTACLKDQSAWDENAVKLAFLIFDAPPHDDKEAALQAAVSAAAEKGIRVIPVVASNADRETELFGRALAILTGGTYVFLTDDSGVGDSHLEPIVGSYEVELLQDLIVRVIDEYRP